MSETKKQTQASFEENFKELEKITKQFEGGKVSLEESTMLYEQGIGLLKTCLSDLSEKKGRLIILRKQADKIIEEVTDLCEQ